MRLNIYDSFIQTLNQSNQEDIFFSLLAGLDQAYDKSELSRLSQRPLLTERISPPKLIGCPKLSLPECKDRPLSASLVDTLRRRESRLDFSGRSTSIDDIAQLLALSAGVTTVKKSGKPRRSYPSGGALYPVNTYLLSKNIDGIREGVFYYSSGEHSLYHVSSDALDFSELFFDQSVSPGMGHAGASGDYLKKASFGIILTAYMERTFAKYGGRSWRLALLESGHLAQNFYLVATALGLKLNAMGGWQASNVNEKVGMQGSNELPVYLIMGGC